MHGSKKTSYQTLESTKLIVRHRRPVDEEVHGARSRQIKSIFIERAGERFKFPHNHLAGARAMARHIDEGGEMHDAVGSYIIESTANLIQLVEFANYARRNKLINEESEDVVKIVRENIAAYKRELQKFQGATSYAKMCEQVANREGSEIEESETGDLKDMFTVRKFDEKMSDTLPLIKKLVTEKNAWRSMIEEASEGEFAVTSTENLIEGDAIEFDSPTQKLGYKIRTLSERVIEESELSKFVHKIGNKMIEGVDLSKFETSVMRNVLENIVVAEAVEEEDGFTDKLEEYATDFERKMKLLEFDLDWDEEQEELLYKDFYGHDDDDFKKLPSGFGIERPDCEECGGSGLALDDESDCYYCNGTGKIDEVLEAGRVPAWKRAGASSYDEYYADRDDDWPTVEVSTPKEALDLLHNFVDDVWHERISAQEKKMLHSRINKGKKALVKDVIKSASEYEDMNELAGDILQKHGVDKGVKFDADYLDEDEYEDDPLEGSYKLSTDKNVPFQAHVTKAGGRFADKYIVSYGPTSRGGKRATRLMNADEVQALVVDKAASLSEEPGDWDHGYNYEGPQRDDLGYDPETQWMDPAGGVHDNDEEDPAKMYEGMFDGIAKAAGRGLGKLVGKGVRKLVDRTVEKMIRGMKKDNVKASEMALYIVTQDEKEQENMLNLFENWLEFNEGHEDYELVKKVYGMTGGTSRDAEAEEPRKIRSYEGVDKRMLELAGVKENVDPEDFMDECPACEGTGKEYGEGGGDDCEKCDGQGYV